MIQAEKNCQCLDKAVVNLSTIANNLEAKVKRQAKEIRKLKVLLKSRDDFIVECGYWHEFTNNPRYTNKVGE